jgi:hypothetical protein
MPQADDNLTSNPVPPARASVVLFDLPGDRFARLASELRRITNQPIRFRWLSTLDDETGRVLVRVENPPAFLVDRLLDSGQVGTAYTEHSAGVWVELGHTPATRLRPPAGQWLLVRNTGAEEIIPAGEFATEIDVLPLPLRTMSGVAGSGVPPIAARLRLVPARDTEPARLWVLRDDALARLTAYCRVTHQQLLARFQVAVSAVEGVPCAVLRAATAQAPPPVFVGPDVSYRLLSQLPNVHVPAGTRLAPAVRRDALRAALAVEPDRVAWLHPLGGGAFRVESLPESAFAPLPDWVDYRVPTTIPAGRAWTQSHGWELAPFVERAEAVSWPVIPPPEPPRPIAAPDRLGLLKRTANWLRKFRRGPRPAAPAPEAPAPVGSSSKQFLRQGERLHHARAESGNKALERCRDLETQFLQALPGMAPDEQTGRWAELAAAYDAVGNPADAALCWLNALWGQPKPSPLWAWGWLRAEARAARPEVRAIDPGPWLATPAGPGTTRALAAWVVWAAQQSPIPTILAERAAEVQARLEAHEHWLPVRAAWLARVTTARLAHGDVLGLARTRDRLSERLLSAGLSLELDTPSFLRFAGEGVRERFQEARRWLADRRVLIHQWLARLPDDAWMRQSPTVDLGTVQRSGLTPNIAPTIAYGDLVLAWGLSRFAEHSAADHLRRQAAASLPLDDAVHQVVREAFEYRIAQVRDGKAPRGPLPAALLARLDSLELQGRYAVDKLREHSRILEPTIRIDAYRESIYRRSPGRSQSPAATLDTVPASRFEDAVRALLTAEVTRAGRPHLPDVAAAALDRAFELTEVGAGVALEILPAALDAAADPALQARLIESGLRAAAAWDRPDVARALANRFLHLADGRAGWDVAEALTGQAFRALRRLGLKTEADRVLHHVAENVLQGQPVARLRQVRPAEWPAALRVLLHAAAGWYYAGRDDEAHAILDEARKDLFAPSTSIADRTALALAYASTLGQASVRVALGRLEEMFQQLKGIAVGGSTNAYYALKPLLLVETAVRAVVSDEFALGPRVRAWLDADELAVRRRIRDELKQVMAGQGL